MSAGFAEYVDIVTKLLQLCERTTTIPCDRGRYFASPVLVATRVSAAARAFLDRHASYSRT
jgi:hypothetical protein